MTKHTRASLDDVIGKLDAIELRAELLGEETTASLKTARKASIKSAQSMLHVLDEHARRLDKLQQFSEFLDAAETLLARDEHVRDAAAAAAIGAEDPVTSKPLSKKPLVGSDSLIRELTPRCFAGNWRSPRRRRS